MRVHIVHDSHGKIASAGIPQKIGKGTLELRGGPGQTVSEIDIPEISTEMTSEIRLEKLTEILRLSHVRFNPAGKAVLERRTPKR